MMLVMCMGWISGPARTGSVATDQSSLKVASVPELLRRYTQTLDSVQSMISTFETSSTGSAFLPPLGMNYNNVNMYSRGQRRTDGKSSIYKQEYMWGYNSMKGRDVREKRATCILRVSTPDFQYNNTKNTRGQTPNGLVLYQKGQTPGWDNFRDESDAFFLGYLGVDVRMDVILKSPGQISVRPKPEIINGSVCYVVESKTAYGRHKLWLDSAHGYQPARVEISRSGDDLRNVAKHSPPPDKRVEGRDSVVIDNIKFKKIQGVWISVEGHTKKTIVWPRHRFFKKDEIHFKTTEITLNPDHDALESFANPIENPGVDPELVNGTHVRLGNDRIECTWRNGRLIDGGGSVIDLNKLLKQPVRSLLNGLLPDLSNLSPTLSKVRTKNKPILLCFIDLQQRPSRQCLIDLSDKSDLLRTHNVDTILIQTSQIDLKKYGSFLEGNRISHTIEIVKGDLNSLKPRWGIKAMPWLILTDENHVVHLEGFNLNELERRIKELTDAKP